MERNDSPILSPRKLKLEQLKADYELFLQTFEKPTLIYRFLRVRHTLAPIFLHRTLSYLKQCKPDERRGGKRRRDARCIELLAKREKAEKDRHTKEKQVAEDEAPSNENHLNIRFTGFFHGPNLTDELAQSIDSKVQVQLFDEFVDVNVNLLKIFHKRRKDESMPMETVKLGQCKATCNPRTELFNNGPTFTVSIPSHMFNEASRSVKTFILSIQLALNVTKDAVHQRAKRTNRSDVFNGLENGSSCDKLDAVQDESSTASSTFADDGAKADTPGSQPKVETILYSAEMIVFDKHKVPLLVDGDYELLLQRTDQDDIIEKENWERGFSDQLGAFNLFSFGPTIKFHLDWDKKPLLGTRPLKLKGKEEPPSNQDALPAKDSCPPQRIFYQFIYSSSTKQQTEARDDHYCPWCMVNCFQLYGLLKHLRLCHARFAFIYTPTSKGARIDVCLNEKFDWNSSKRRSVGSPQYALLRGEGPIKQTPETLVLVERATVIKDNLAEFFEPEYGAVEGAGSSAERVYYHTNSCLPLLPQELECDSEDEKAPEWIKEKTTFMIDEFTDVNPGEKELTKMWNIHVLAEGFIADFQVTQACQVFVTKCGRDIIARRLQRNFLLHLCNLADFGLLPLAHVQQLMASLRAIDVEE